MVTTLIFAATETAAPDLISGTVPHQNLPNSVAYHVRMRTFQMPIEVLALITARGASKGIPRKNIRKLCGVPLISYTIDAAQQSNTVTRIIVSTDDIEIAEIASAKGAEIPFLRPACLAADDTPDWPVFEHCLSFLNHQQQYCPDVVIHLRPTSPFRTAKHIDEAVTLFRAHSELDSIRSVFSSPYHPLKMWRLQCDHILVPFVPTHIYDIVEAYNQPRQSLPAAYFHNGAVDITTPNIILEKRSMTGTRIGAYVMDDPIASIDIDCELDWLFAEWLITAGKWQLCT